MKLLTLLFVVPFISLVVPVADLEKRLLLDDKVEILLPKDWKPMKEELVKIKYPGTHPPKLVYSDISGAVSVAFNHTGSKADSSSIEKYRQVLKTGLTSAYPDATWDDEGVKEINGKKVGFFKVTTQISDDKIYNYMLFTDLDGKLLICSFNCTAPKVKTWKPIADQIMGSIVFKN